jgi:hypothetical protein
MLHMRKRKKDEEEEEVLIALLANVTKALYVSG